MGIPYVLFVATNAAVIGPNSRPTGFLTSKAYRRLARSRRLADVDVLDYDAVFSPAASVRWWTSPAIPTSRRR